jgi:type IV pilus assembly protein PilV
MRLSDSPAWDAARDRARRAPASPAKRVVRERLRGAFLLEALVALVVFSVGAVALLGLIANALRASGTAQWRSEAFDIAASTLSRMWTEDPAALPARYDAAASGPGYRALLAAAMRLPGVSGVGNAPVVTIDDASGRSRVSVTVYWQAPSEAGAHRASVNAVLPGP